MTRKVCNISTVYIFEIVIDQHNAIRAEIANKYPLLASRKTLHGAFEFKQVSGKSETKLVNLSRRYQLFRKIRPDGNCFYRALIVGAIEASIELDVLDRFRDSLRDVAERCKSVGYDSFAIDEFFELVDEQIGTLMAEPSSDSRLSTLERIFNDSSVDGYAVAFARCACGAALKEWKDEYGAFLPEPYSSIDAFCRGEVDPMNKDADQLQVVATARILGVRLSIAYVDESDSEEANILEFGDPSSPLRVCMIYRPGHYDLLYPSSSIES